MKHAQELRQQAELCRRVARVKTTGGSTEDRALISLADELERAADLQEQLFIAPAAKQRRPTGL